MTFTRSQYAMAASLAALIIAAPIAFRVADMPRYEETGEANQKPAPEITANQNAAADKPRTDALTERGRLEAEKKLRQVPPPASTALTAVPGAPRAGNVGPESSIAGLASPSAAPAAAATRRFGPMQMGGGISGAINTADADRQRVVADEGFRDQFEATSINPLKQVASEPVSTFSIDVDTAIVRFRAPGTQCGTFAAEGRRAHRGDDQLLRLCLSLGRKRIGAVQADRDGCSIAVEPV